MSSSTWAKTIKRLTRLTRVLVRLVAIQVPLFVEVRDAPTSIFAEEGASSCNKGRTRARIIPDLSSAKQFTGTYFLYI